MFGRKSTNSLPKDSGATIPADAPPSVSAMTPALNSGLSFALMEERTCVSLMHKLSGSHLEGKLRGVLSTERREGRGEERGGED